MSRSQKRFALREHQPRKSATPRSFVLISYNSRGQPLLHVGTCLRSRLLVEHESKSLTIIIQRLIRQSTWGDQKQQMISIPGQLDQPGGDLSAREVEVLRQIANGMITTEVAAELGISLRTVQTHVKHIMKKMNAKNRTEAVLKAIHWGIIGLESSRSTSLPRPKGRTRETRAKKRS